LNFRLQINQGCEGMYSRQAIHTLTTQVNGSEPDTDNIYM